MSLEALRRHCATLAGATRDVKWGADEVFSVGGKMFAVFWVEHGKARTAAFKCDAERFLELTDVPGVVPAPYLARAHWVQVRDTSALDGGTLSSLVDRSHAIVLSKLPVKVRNAIAKGGDG